MKIQNKEVKKLEIGAGRRPTKGYEHLDILSGNHIEIVADARKIPMWDETYDEIYSHWVFEHFAYRELMDVLREWYRVLKPNGIIKIVTSNQEAHNKCLSEEIISWEEWVRLTFGMKEAHELKENDSFIPTVYECHKIGFTEKSLNNFLTQAGFINVSVVATWQCREANGDIKCPGLIAEGRKP